VSVVANVAINVDSRNAVVQLQRLENATKSAAAGVAGLVASLGAGFAFGQLIKSASQFEAELGEIGKTAGASEKEIANLAVALKGLSTPSKTNLAPSVLAAGIKDLVAQGLKLNDAVASMETLGKVAVATNSELADVTKTGFQLQSALKIRPDELKATFDALAFAGKAGAFELKDMAQFMPTIASAATSIGITGKDGAVALAAMMQMVRKDAPGAAEASTRLTDALLKMTAPDAVKNFAKFGVNIEQVLKSAVAKGINPMDAALKELQRITGGDAFKLSQIFGDKEAKLALMSLMKYREEYEKLKAAAGGAAAAGTVQGDFAKSLETFNGKLQTLQTSGEILALSLGNTLLPILARLIEEILPIIDGIARFVQGMGQIPKPVIDAAIGLGKMIIQLMLVDKALKIAMGTAALFRGAMLLLTTQTTLAAAAALTGQARFLMLAGGIKGAGVAAATATPALLGLLGVLLRLAAIGTIAIVVNVAVTGMAAVYQAQAEIDRLRGARAKGGAAAAFGGSATAEQKKTQQDVLTAIKKERESPEFWAQQAAAAVGVGVGRTMARQRADLLDERERSARAILALPLRKTPTPAANARSQQTGTGTGTGTDGTGGAKKERESQLADILAANGLFRSQETIAARIAVAEVDRNTAEVARLQHIDRSVQLLHAAAAIQRSSIPLDEKQAQLRGVQDKLVASTNQYEREIAAEKIAQTKAATEQLQQMQDEQDLLKAKLAGNEAEVRLNQEVAALKKQFPSLDEKAIRAALKVTEALKKQVEVAKQMKQVYADIGMSIKDGVVGAIRGAIDGTKSLQEVASNLLQKIANTLLDVAVNLALFGAMSGTGTGGGLLGFLFKSAKGSVYAQSGIQPFARGGIVSSPTLFKFADGGATRTGLMGEAGPEAIMPLKRGSDGSLGVQANGLREAMNQDRAAAGGTHVLNMSFQTTRFGDTEYVSRDQLEAAMIETRRVATNDGARRGMSMTLDRIRQSPQTRNRIGIR